MNIRAIHIILGLLIIGPLVASMEECQRHRDDPLGEKAPTFGTTPQTKTFRDFVMGRWKMKYVTSHGAENAAKEVVAFLNTLKEYVTIKPDGTFEHEKYRCLIEGYWRFDDTGIVLMPRTVDQPASRYMESDKSLMEDLHLTLYSDQKRLFNDRVGSTTGNTPLDCFQVWERMPDRN